jgi:hypothetical protein
MVPKRHGIRLDADIQEHNNKVPVRRSRIKLFKELLKDPLTEISLLYSNQPHCDLIDCSDDQFTQKTPQ